MTDETEMKITTQTQTQTQSQTTIKDGDGRDGDGKDNGLDGDGKSDGDGKADGDGKVEKALPSSLREAIYMALHQAKEKNLSEYMTVLKIEEHIRDLIVVVFPQHTDRTQEMMMSWFTRVTGR